jgi:hypothetical protein
MSCFMYEGWVIESVSESEQEVIRRQYPENPKAQSVACGGC